jgi:hypothetical protein
MRLMLATSSALIFTGLCVAATGCASKSEKTCEPAELVAPWTDLGVAEGQVCDANEHYLGLIVNNPDAIAYALSLGKKLEKKGWKDDEATMNPSVIGKEATVLITAWKFTKGDKTITVSVDSLPPSVWKDDPIRVALKLD